MDRAICPRLDFNREKPIRGLGNGCDARNGSDELAIITVELELHL
jgi:hypothetical protein